MAVHNYDATSGDGVAVGSPKLGGRVVVLPETGAGTEWHSYPAGAVYRMVALSRFHFRREIRLGDGSTATEEFDLQPGSSIVRNGPFEHKVTSLTTGPAVFLKE